MAAEFLAACAGRALDKLALRPQVRAVVTSLLRQLPFMLLAALLAVASGLFGARTGFCGAAADSGAGFAQESRLHGAPAPVAPLHADLPADAELASAEDSPDDEELADLGAGLLGRVQRPMQHAPVRIQLEPAHAPSTQLDRPPRA